MTRKDLAIRTALDMQKYNKTFAGSPLMTPINPQQAALGYGSAIKAALSIIGTYTIYDDGFGNSVGASDHNFVAHVSYNVPDFYSWTDIGLNPEVTIIKAGLCWVHLHVQGDMTLDGTNPKSLSSSIRQRRGGIDIDDLGSISTSLAGVTGFCNGDTAVLFDVLPADIISIALAANWPDISNSPIDVRLEVMQIY
jgi:hypothetical protein